MAESCESFVESSLHVADGRAALPIEPPCLGTVKNHTMPCSQSRDGTRGRDRGPCTEVHAQAVVGVLRLFGETLKVPLSCVRKGFGAAICMQLARAMFVVFSVHIPGRVMVSAMAGWAEASRVICICFPPGGRARPEGYVFIVPVLRDDTYIEV